MAGLVVLVAVVEPLVHPSGTELGPSASLEPFRKEYTWEYDRYTVARIAEPRSSQVARISETDSSAPDVGDLEITNDDGIILSSFF